jgi:CO/xanthine dehydrogenase FAD-binding subunit
MQDGTVSVVSPATLREALRLLAEGGDAARPLAGGTDAMVKAKDGVWKPRMWINLLRLRPELTYIRPSGESVEVGALTSFSTLLASPVIEGRTPLLAKAIRTVGGPQVRNMGTIGGNIATASPAGDSLPALYALDAAVKVVSLRGEREVPIDEFITGPGRTALQPGELIYAVKFATQSRDELCAYEKLGLRSAHAIAVASMALRIAPTFTGKGMRLARVALGAVAPTVVRVPEAESALLNACPMCWDVASYAVAAARAAAQPISDLRATAEYRRAMAGNLLLRGLARLLGPGVLPSGVAMGGGSL